MTRLVAGTFLAVLLAVALACGKSPTSPDPTGNPNNLPLCASEPRDARPSERLPCPSRAEIDQINQDISITFNNDTTAGSLVCRQQDGSADLSYLQALTFMQIAYMRRMAFTRPLPWTSESLYDWFRAAIRGVIVETGTGPSYCCSPSKVIHIAYSPTISSDPTPLTPGYVDPGVLVHEARHAEIGPHTCIMEKTQTSVRAGDYTIAEMRAAGVEYSLFEWLAKYSDEPQGVKDHFTWRAWGLRNQYIFCNECYRPPGGPIR